MLQYIASLVSSTSNMNAIAASYLLENEWRCISDEDHCMPLTLSCTVLEGDNAMDSVNINHSDSTVTDRKRDAWYESALKLVILYHNWKYYKFSIDK
jgi:hypothetical protein